MNIIQTSDEDRFKKRGNG